MKLMPTQIGKFVQDPPCRDWHIWVGFEIEGSSQRGVKTLFVRRFAYLTKDGEQPVDSSFPPDAVTVQSPSEIFARAKAEGIDRIWFCEEMFHPSTGYGHIVIIQDALSKFSTVCLCIDIMHDHIVPPLSIQDQARLYFKCDVSRKFPAPKPSDHICFGPRFKDVGFRYSDGQVVQPQDYMKDERWY